MKPRIFFPRAGAIWTLKDPLRLAATSLSFLALLLTFALDAGAANGPGNALRFDGSDDHVQVGINAPFPDATNTFTIELWVNPAAIRGETAETNDGISGLAGQRFAVFPDHGFNSYYDDMDPAGSTGHVGTGLSIGANGISVFEHGFGYLPSLLVHSASISGWTHVALVYIDKVPSLYVNGELARYTGLKSTKTFVHPSVSLAGSIQNIGLGYYQGELDEVRIWKVARTPAEIQENMNRILAGDEPNLVVYFRCDEETGFALADSAPASPTVTGALENGVSRADSGALLSPLVNTEGITGQNFNGGVILNGKVNPLGLPTSAWFEWGTDTSYRNMTTPLDVGAGSIYLTASALLSGLQQGRTYHYRCVAANSNGRANGGDQSFTQPVYPHPAGVPPIRSSIYDGGFTSFAAFDARPEWDTSVAMTIEAWVFRQDTNRFEAIVSHDAPGSYWLGLSPRLRFYRGTNFTEVPRLVPAFKWTHVAVSYDGVAARFYFNGEFVGVRPLSHTGAGKLRPLRLGYDDSHDTEIGPINGFLGSLDEVRVWSVARSGEEIRAGMYRELRGEPGLAAVFPRGGRGEEVSGLVGRIGSGVTEQVFGMAPRDLVVPRSPIQPVADGAISLATEYAGADMLVLRFPDFPTIPDATAHFVHTDNDLFVGVAVSGRLGEYGNILTSWLSLFVDTTNGRPALAEFPQVELRAQLDADTNHVALLNGDGAGGYFACFTPPDLGLPQPCTPRNFWDARQLFCGFEIFLDACAEFRVSRSLLGSFNEFDGVGLGLFKVTGFGDQSFTPEDSLPNAPAAWVTMTYGEGSATLPRVHWSGRVLAGITNTSPVLAGHRVSLHAGGAAYSQLTDGWGMFNFDVPMPTGQVLYAQVDNVGFGRYRLPVVRPFGTQPFLVFTNDVRYPALSANSSGTIQLADVDFFVQKPLPASGLTGASPISPVCGSSGSACEAGGPGEIVTLFGTNLHAEMDFYLSPYTTAITPGEWHLIRAEVLDIATDRTWVKVRAPFVPEQVPRVRDGVFVNAFQSLWRWVSCDRWFRPGAPSDSYFGQFGIERPPYPLMHGFSFRNQGADAALNEFLACYGYNAYLCVGEFGVCATHVPDPLYWAIWWPVYYLWIGATGGSCVGMASTAMQLHSGALDAGDFDACAFTAIGIDNRGFPGQWDTGNTGGRYTRPPIPMDIWARIRMNHGIQTSLEYIITGLNQLDLSFSSGVRGDPVARLNEIRPAPTLFTISMVPEPGSGHCVSPYRIEDNYDGDPNISRIWIYDNNTQCARTDSATAFCVTNRFIDINRSANTYTFNTGSKIWNGTALFATPRNIYNGERHSPISSDIPISDIPRLMGIIAGGADGHYSISNKSWGWRADGTFVDNFPGLAPLSPVGSPDNFTRGVPVFLAISNNVSISNTLPVITVNVRDTNAHIFHAAANGTLLQLEVSRGQPATSNQIRLGAISNQLASFQFRPQVTISNFIPRIGFAISNGACATFQWLGLEAVSNKTQEFRALKNERAVDYRNDTGKPTQHYLRIDAVDCGTSNNTCAVFGPFNVPTGAVHCVVLQDWPRVKQVRSELDLNADGTPDQMTMVTGAEIDSDGDGMPDAWIRLRRLPMMLYQLDTHPEAQCVSRLRQGC